MTISQLLTSLLTVVAVLVMMLTISPLLTLLTVITVPLSLWVTRAIARRSQRLFVAQWANTGRLNAHIEETYSGFTVGQDVRSPGQGAGAVPATSTTTSTTPASAHSSSPDWWDRRRRSSAT